MKHTPDFVPPAPARLYDDRRILKQAASNAWDGRRANKMRERYAITDCPVVPCLGLVAPVQPSISPRNPAGVSF